MLIVIIGPDGCGKTTIANELQASLSERGIKVDHYAMNFEILPKLRDIINPFLKNKIVNTNVEGQHYVGMIDKPNTKLRGAAIATWYTLDYSVGGIKLLLRGKKNHVTIFARYFYDYYFQRAHINTPKFYLYFLEIFIPRPNFIFTIKRDSASIFHGKPELSIQEIERQQQEIEIFLQNKTNAFIIDGNKGVSDTMQRIIRILDNEC